LGQVGLGFSPDGQGQSAQRPEHPTGQDEAQQPRDHQRHQLGDDELGADRIVDLATFDRDEV
jgi:hypothetical protein